MLFINWLINYHSAGCQLDPRDVTDITNPAFFRRIPRECVRVRDRLRRGDAQCGPSLRSRTADQLRLRSGRQPEGHVQVAAGKPGEGKTALSGRHQRELDPGGRQPEEAEDKTGQPVEVGRLFTQHGLRGGVLRAVPGHAGKGR